MASFLEVFLNTSRFKEEKYYSHFTLVTLPILSDYTPHFIHHAKCALKKIYKSGFAYKKVGVMLGGITSNQAVQQDLFIETQALDQKHRILMQLMDKANTKYGKDTIKLAAQGLKQDWKMKKNHCSSHFTTSWDELLQIKI